MSYKKIIFIISFLAVFGLMFTPLEIAGPWQTNKESESLTGFNFNAPTIQAMTIGEIQALIHQLQQQINRLQQQLQGLRDEVPQPYPFEWGWEACTPERPCAVGQGDCDRDADCAPGLFCAQNVGAKYGQHPLMDVCEREEPPAKEDIPLIFSKYYTIATPRITPEEIFHYNPTKDSGWFYIAQTIPENGIAFWAAPMRTLSTTPTDNSAPLLYGITNINTGEYYAGFLPDGSFSESVGEIDLFYQWGGEKLIEFSQTKTDLSEFKLKVNLPWNEDSFQLERTLTLSRPILYPSGDGIIPMAEGIESLYASIVTDQGFWIDFQKFNVGGKPLPRETNHRWGCFILNKPVGILPAGTIGVGWEILDENNQRQPGGFTNVDLIVPGFPQFTATEPEISMGEIEVIETWDSNNKTYLRKWKMSYPGGIELLFETVIPNQENVITITTQENVTINHYFYEGMIRVIDPQTGEVVGTGMLEQTHDEASAVKKFEWGWEACTPERPCTVGQGDCDRDADCAPGLFCAQNVGAKYGQHPLMDVCEVKPSITVISPNGGEKWVIGHRYDITWKSVGDVGMIDILLVDHRVSPSETVIATNIPAPAGKYSWTIPRDITPGENTFTISIRGKAINDSSDHYFSILQPIVPQPIVPPCDSYGDVNADGFVTKADATLVSEYVVNKITLTEEQKRKADVNQDGTITIVDAMMISQFAERIRDTLPACVKLSPCPPYGDVNHNKYVNLMDSFLIAEFVVGRITLTPAEQERADVNQDGTVTIVDAMMISQYVKGERDTFPVCGDEAKNIITPTCEYLLRGIQDNFMAQYGDANYNPVFDLNKDKIINISDFGLIVANQDNEAWCKNMKAATEDPCRVGLRNIHNQLASISEAVSRLIESMKRFLER